MKAVLVNGDAGFIGSKVVRHLYPRYPEYRLRVVDALTYAGSIQASPNRALGSKRYEFSCGNVCNGELFDTLV